MKKWGRLIIVLILCTVLISTSACSSFGKQRQDVSSRLAKATRGNLVASVSGNGNIEVAKEAKLAFGVGGKVTKIYVDEGNKVKKGDVLAKLETNDLELALSQAETAQKQAEVAVPQAEFAVSQAEVGETQAEVAKTQAEVALETAKFDLDRMDEVQKIKDKIEEGENEQKVAEANLKASVEAKALDIDIRNWGEQVSVAKQKIAENQQKLAELLSKDEYASLRVSASLKDTEVKIKALQVKLAEQTVQQTIQTVKQTKLNTAQAKRNVELAKKSLEYANKSVEYARKQLDKATITAPLDGLVVSVNADEGDTIPSPTVSPKTVIHIIDLTSLELKVDIDEIDVPSVKLGQKAVISVDALPAVTIEGKVSYISPLPSPQSGVILYKVTIGFQVPPDSPLKVGMSATADIVLNERQNVLLIPDRAIYKNSQGNTMVKVMVGDQEQERAVVTGTTDGFDTEIISGLSEGETVVVETKTKSQTSGAGFMGQ